MQLTSVLKTLNLATLETACDVIRVNKAALYSPQGLLVMLTLWALKQDFSSAIFTINSTQNESQDFITSEILRLSQKSNLFIPK